MLKINETENTPSGVGVIVGRFQVANLEGSLLNLFTEVAERHDKLIIVLCHSIVKASMENPLDYGTRRKMIADKLDEIDLIDFEFFYIPDCQLDNEWSKKLDSIVNNNVPGSVGGDITYYGSKKQFIDHYTGSRKCIEYAQDKFESSIKERNKITNKIKGTEQFRLGCISTVYDRYPVAYPTVDIAILDKSKEKILLGKKPGEDNFRLIGGFVDPERSYGLGALERNAAREVMEETGISVDSLSYVGSAMVDDWRYRNSRDKIMTTLFVGIQSDDLNPVASDDIEEVKWFDINGIRESVQTTNVFRNLRPEHCTLMEGVVDWLYNQNK